MQGWIQGFHWGGGGVQKIMWVHAQREREAWCLHTKVVGGGGVQGVLKGPGSSRVLFRAIWALFLSILILNGIFK